MGLLWRRLLINMFRSFYQNITNCSESGIFIMLSISICSKYSQCRTKWIVFLLIFLLWVNNSTNCFHQQHVCTAKSHIFTPTRRPLYTQAVIKLQIFQPERIGSKKLPEWLMRVSHIYIAESCFINCLLKIRKKHSFFHEIRFLLILRDYKLFIIFLV